MKYCAAYYSDIGIQKETNQDSLLLVQRGQTQDDEAVLAVICDGVGGLKMGERSSAAVVTAFRDWFDERVEELYEQEEPETELFDDWDNLIQSLHIRLKDNSEKAGFRSGTTVEAVLFMKGRYYICHVGDCRTYIISDFGDFCTVCAVCDGMGGLTGGERASALAAHGVTRYLLEHAQAEDIPTEMGRAALRLNEEVKNLRDPANQKIEAGTTLTTVFLRNGKLFWCSIGDSHIYLYRDGTLEQLNIDHNFGAQLDQMALEGSITQDEALHHPQRAALTSYLGISELTLISGNRMPFQLRKGDVLIQCTDGLYRYLPDSTMCRILAVTGNLKQAAEQMVKTALAVPGGHDNTSVLLARYKG